jgi:hypothetical protein
MANSFVIFVVQFLWFLVAWTTIAVLIVEPRLRGCSRNEILAVWILPQVFRILGLGLLVPSLSPDMPRSFAVPTAVGDALTSLLALIATIALVKRWPRARRLAWAANLVGSADLVVALPHAAVIGASHYLAGQWYVPALVVPLMITSHAMAFRALLQREPSGRREPSAGEAGRTARG